MMGLMSEITLFSNCNESSRTKGGDAPWNNEEGVFRFSKRTKE
jgi:hypothetical protein